MASRKFLMVLIVSRKGSIVNYTVEDLHHGGPYFGIVLVYILYIYS